MKYLLVFLVIFLVAWRWRSMREAEQSQTQHKKAQSKALPVDVVECAHCGVHVPQAEAVHGKRGVYCSSGHRSVVES
jgi:uncharacterized protein